MIKEKLKSERQKLLTALQDYMKELQSQSTQELITIPVCQETSDVIKEIMRIRLMQQRTDDVQKIASKLLDDLPNYENFEFVLKETINDLRHQNTELFESWCNSVIMAIKNETLRYCYPVLIQLVINLA